MREDQVIRPDGHPGIYGVVETRIATGVVALDDQRQVMWLASFATPPASIPGRSSREAARKAKPRLPLQCASFVKKPGWSPRSGSSWATRYIFPTVIPRRLQFSSLRKLRQTESSPDGTELLQIKKLPFSDALRMVDAGEVKDAMTIIGLIRASQFLKLAGEDGSAGT